MAITIRAIYKDGVLKPEVDLGFPEGVLVKLTVTEIPSIREGNTTFASLRGLWKGLPFPDPIELSIQEIRAESARRIERMALELSEALEALEKKY